MKRIDSANKAENLFGPGKHGFKGGNPAANEPATFFTPDWSNNIQEEIANFIEAAGITLDGAQRNQLLLAFQAMNSADAGKVSAFATSSAPAGWLKANGAVVSQTTYAALYAKIGLSFNTGGEGAGNFRLPDLRGEFVRGWDDGRGIDMGRLFGSGQAAQMPSHRHSFSVSGGSGGTNQLLGASGQSPATNETNSAGGTENGSENRPRNVALLFCIKY